MKKIDIENWKRKTTYDNFIKYSNPSFSVGTRVDVTALVEYCKNNDKSFFAMFLYAVMVAVNSVEEMRTRIINDEVYLFDTIRPSYIVALHNEELVTCVSDMTCDLDLFYKNIRHDIDEVVRLDKPQFNAEFVADCVYVSCLPWLDFVSVSNPYNYEDKASASIPRITWGKYVKNSSGRYEIALDIAAHHALIDGKQVAKVFEKINEKISDLEQVLRSGKNER